VDKAIMSGCDLHEKNMLLKTAVGREKPHKRSFSDDPGGRARMVAWLKKLGADAGAERIVFAYEASHLGFGLYDDLTGAGVECYVLAPTHLPKTPKNTRNKTDERDAQKIFEVVRGHVLAGNDLPAVWVPDPQTRDDREIVRARLDVREKATRVKAQIHSLLKRHDVRKPASVGNSWTRRHRAWLLGLTQGGLFHGARVHMESLLRQLDGLEVELGILDAAVEELSQEPRYARASAALRELSGVGLLTAMVFLTELGDPMRFVNRKQVGGYLGLAPSSRESGERSERKGHITRQGPSRVRKVLCQAVWCRLGCDADFRARHERIAGGKAKGRKIATVALMRQLAVKMWRIARDAWTSPEDAFPVAVEAA